MMQKILAWDANISQRLRVAEKPGWLRRFATVLAHSGDSWLVLIVLAIVGWFGTPAWREKMIIFGISVVITAGLVLIVKFAVRRKRPEGEWGNIYRSTDPHSFPSGHAARAFLLATLAVAFGPAWFGVALAVWAPLVALARIAMGVHYFSDVFVGGLFGIFAGYITYSVVVGIIIATVAT